MAPKPKIPAEYANVAKRLSSEVGDDVSKQFDEFLDKQAADLSSNLDSRSVPDPKAVEGVKAAGIFAKTDSSVQTDYVRKVPGASEQSVGKPKTPDVNNPADFEVSMDELLQGFKEPKAVEGSGVMKPSEVFGGFANKYDTKTGVLMGEESGKYTPNNSGPHVADYPLTPRSGGVAVQDIRLQNARINENNMDVEMETVDPNKKYNKEFYDKQHHLFSNDKEFYNPEGGLSYAGIKENIPTLAAGTVGAGVLLSSQNAEAREPKLEDELQFDTSYAEPAPKISLTQKAIANTRTAPSGILTQNGNTSTIMDEVDTLINRAKSNLGTFAKDVGSAYTQYQAEKDALSIKAQEWINATEAKGGMLSDDDKELMKDFVGVVEGSPSVAVGSGVDAVFDGVSKFNHEVIQPIKGVVRQGYHKLLDGRREWEQQHVPSIAVLNDTLAYPLLGSTGWNVKPDSVGFTDSDEDMEKGMSQLDPEVRKLFDDKTALLGTDAGKAMFVFANKFADLPLWLIGGTGKLGLMLGGAANEAASDDPEADLTRGAGLGLAGGAVINKIVAPVARKGISLLGKVKLDTSGVMDVFGKVTYDSNPEHIAKVWKAFVNKNFVEPLLLMTGKTATKMADDAVLKVRPDVSEAMNTQVIAPQALVLGIDAATGKPKLYGVKDGLYGELSEHVNPEGRPVLINQIAKQEWFSNKELVETWNKLIDPKRKTPASRKHGIDEWTPDVIPPENPALVYAWKQAADGAGMAELYRAGSRDFTKDLLKSRALVRVEFTHPDGRSDTGVGYWSNDIVFAPDAAENIPGAITRDLTLKQVRLNPIKDWKGNHIPGGVQPELSGIKPENQAWEINRLTDDELYRVVDDIKARNELEREATLETVRGGTMSDGVPLPDKRPPNDFDVGMNAVGPALAAAGGIMADNPNASAAAAAAVIAFLPPTKRAIGKALTKMNTAAGKLGLISDTVYGEKFKVDASIQAFSLRHYARLTNDLNKQLIDSFKDAAQTPLQRQQFNDQLKYFIENHQVNNPAPLPPQLQPAIQQKVQKFVAERNYEYALIEQLGGTVPDKTKTGNAELERMFALDYFREGNAGYEKEAYWKKFYHHVTGYNTSDNQWIDRLRKSQPQHDVLINLLTNKEASKQIGKTTRAYDQVMGRMSTETEMASDYMNRKLKLNQLAFMKELADNTMASSPIVNQALGHTKQVTFNDAGLLKGKYVSDETFKAIHTYPKDQIMVQNTLLGVVNMIKFNKTVLNPTTWVKNIMGNVWGVMNSNIVHGWNMAYRMPRGMNIMRKDLAKFNADVMANDARVHRVHETLKYGLLGNEFESSRTKMLDVLDNLAEPIAQTSNRTWGEKIAHGYFMAKDNTLGGLAHVYSKVDMATKYSLYVNGLERWGIDLNTNKIYQGATGRRMAADLLGATTAHNWQIDDDTLTDMIKREIVRRIHLSLPMVDRIGPIATALNKLSPLTNPWLRTASELTRITLQMPYRMFNEKGYSVNALKTASFLGTILGVNKALRLREGISDETVDDAKRIAPSNLKDYMPGATATKFYAGEGKDRGIVHVDLANLLIEPAQWFKGGEVSTGAEAGKRLAANGIDLIMGGGLLKEESDDAQIAMGLKEAPQQYGIPLWKQGDLTRWVTQKAVNTGPQIFNNAWQLYSTNYLPNKIGVRGNDVLEQPMSMQILKSLGIPVATFGSKNQKEYKLDDLENREVQMIKKGNLADMQTEGSDTGKFQKTYNSKEVEARYEAEEDKIGKEIELIEKSKPVKSTDKDKKINLLNTKNMRTPHL